MSILADTQLETIDYGQPLWNHIHNANVDRLNGELLYLNALLDIDVSEIADGAVLSWDASAGKFVARVFS